MDPSDQLLTSARQNPLSHVAPCTTPVLQFRPCAATARSPFRSFPQLWKKLWKVRKFCCLSIFPTFKMSFLRLNLHALSRFFTFYPSFMPFPRISQASPVALTTPRTADWPMVKVQRHTTTHNAATAPHSTKAQRGSLPLVFDRRAPQPDRMLPRSHAAGR